MNRTYLVAVILIVLGLVGCGPRPEPASSGQQGAESSSATPPVLVTPSAPTDQPLVILERSGGFAGVTEAIVVYGDGTVVMDGETGRVGGGATAAADLIRQIEATGIYDLKTGKYLAANPCCDRFTYELTLVKEGQKYQYVTMDGAENVPPELVAAISLIRDYAESAIQS
jgi:hypothetical protein